MPGGVREDFPMSTAESDFHRKNLEIMKLLAHWMDRLQEHVFRMEREHEVYEMAVTDSLCELSDRIAPLEGKRHG